MPDFQRPVEVRYFNATDPKLPENLIEEDPLTLKARAKAKAKAKAIEEEEFHLSPLAQVIGTWPSAVQSFRALVDEDDDLKKTCRMKESELKSEGEEDADQMMGDDSATPLPIPRSRQLTDSAAPLPIPRSRQLTDSSVSSSVATVNADNWSGLSRSRPHDDIIMSSRPPSPSHAPSTERSSTLVRSSAHSPSRRLSREQSMTYMSSRTASPSRRYSSDRPYSSRMKETYSRDAYDVGNREFDSRPVDTHEPKPKEQLVPRQSISSDDFRDKNHERLRAQLHDILDSPMASSSLHISQRDEPPMPTPMPPPPPPLSSTIPRSTTASTRVQTPLRRMSISQQAPSSTSTPDPEDGYPSVVVPKTLVHASSVAMQQEKERREREKQRELERERAERDRERRDRDRDRDREREAEWQHYSSLKDATNAPPDAYHYRERTTGRTKLASNPVAALAHG